MGHPLLDGGLETEVSHLQRFLPCIDPLCHHLMSRTASRNSCLQCVPRTGASSRGLKLQVNPDARWSFLGHSWLHPDSHYGLLYFKDV